MEQNNTCLDIRFIAYIVPIRVLCWAGIYSQNYLQPTYLKRTFTTKPNFYLERTFWKMDILDRKLCNYI